MATPGDYPTGLNLWLKADAITGQVDDDALGTWSDSSGNANHASNAMFARQPTYKTNVQNGMAVVRFNGTTNALASAASSSGGAQTVVAVVKPTNLGAVNTIRGGGYGNGNTGGLQFRVEAASNSYPRFVKEGLADIGSGSTAVASSAWQVVTGTWDDATNAYAFTIDGAAAGSGSSSETLTAGRGSTIGANGSPSGADPVANPSEFFAGDIAEIAAWSVVLNPTDLAAVVSGLQSKWGLTSSAVTVAAPVAAVSVVAPAPTVTAGNAVSVAAPVAALVMAMLAPTVSAGTSVVVSPPVAAVTIAAPAPSVEISTSVTVAPPAAALTVAALAPVVTAGSSVSVAAPVAVLTFSAPAPVASTTPAVLLLSAPSPIGASLASFEVSGSPSTVLLLSAPSPIGGSLRIVPVASPVPPPFNQRPVRRQAHLMEPKSQANPRKMGDYLRTRAEGDDGYTYPIETADVGMLRVFASGIDVTWLTGAPTTIHDWSFGKPFNCQAASFTIPLREWQIPGVGALSILWADASVEVMLEDSEGNLTSLWDGFTAEETDTAAPGQTGVTWHCEGTLYQAAHWPHDPPVIMDPRDVGHVIADAMNSVPNRRYAKVRRFTTGILTEDRGDSSMSVLEYVAGLIGKTFDDDGNQLMFRRDAALSYRLDWCLPVVTPHWTYTKGSPGFASTLRRPHSSRRDALFGRGFAPDGGFWKGQVFPGLVSGMPPAYPMANPSESMSVGTTDADTVGGMGVSTWQRKMRERGYPVTVDGVMNAADTTWVRRVQKDQGLFVDGVLGPQTWAGSWEGGEQTPETLTYRLPLSVKDTARPYDYDASGKILRDNPLFDRRAIVYATPEVDAGTNIKKSTAIPLFDKILDREATPGYVGSMTATGVDPWEEGASRFLIAAGDNVEVLGHHGDTLVQLADVTHTPTSTRMTGDSRARGQAVVDAIMARQRDALRSLAAKQTRITDRGTLNASQLGQYESESPAGKYSRTAINGDHGLWTVRCIYVAEQGLARFRLTTSPRAEIVTLILGRRATPNQIAAICPDPLDSDAGWYDAEQELRERFGLVEVAGTPSNPGGYFPQQKGEGSLTGVQAVGNLSMKSQRGGFFWVASFTSRSTFLEGEFEPEVPL